MKLSFYNMRAWLRLNVFTNKLAFINSLSNYIQASQHEQKRLLSSLFLKCEN